jgi:hypothetical protein
VGEAGNRLGTEVLKAALSALLLAPDAIRALKDLGARLEAVLKKLQAFGHGDPKHGNSNHVFSGAG